MAESGDLPKTLQLELATGEACHHDRTVLATVQCGNCWRRRWYRLSKVRKLLLCVTNVPGALKSEIGNMYCRQQILRSSQEGGMLGEYAAEAALGICETCATKNRFHCSLRLQGLFPRALNRNSVRVPCAGFKKITGTTWK